MSLAGKRLLVIGGAGFIGSHLVDQLLATDAATVGVYGSMRSAAKNLPLNNPRLQCIDGSVTDAGALGAAMDGIDGVFLLTSLWLKECATDPRSGFEVNVLGGFNVLEACRQAGVGRIVYASSTAVYGEAVSDPIDEHHPLKGSSFYGATKIAVEQFLQAYHAQYQLPYLVCRLSQVYGPRQAAKGDATSVIIRFLDRIDAGQPPVIFGTGDQSYDFVYVEDAARAMLLAMQASDIEAETVNIASGEATSLKHLVHTILAIQGSSLAVEYHDAERPGTPAARIDVARAEHSLGFSAHIGLDDGLRRMIAWRKATKELQ
jgi:UDP-glucose 4-epimerase